MFIRKLNYLLALSQERHFGRAAQRCHVSQPALSVAIHSLEEELGIALVQRSNHRFQGFTAEGTRVLLWAQRLLDDYDNLREEAKAKRSAQPSGTLKIGAIPAVLPLIPKLTESSLKSFPGVHYEIYTLSALEILRRLGNCELDIGISYMEDARLKHFSNLWVFRERYLLLYSSKQADTTLLPEGEKEMSWAAAARLPLCMFTNSLQCRQGMNKVFSEAGAQVCPLVETDSLAVLYGQVVNGGLYGILPHSILCYGVALGGIGIRPMQNNLQRDIGLIVRSQRLPGKLLECALEKMRAVRLQEWVDGLLHKMTSA